MAETDAGSPKEIEKTKPTFLDKIRGSEKFIYTALSLGSLAVGFGARLLDLPIGTERIILGAGIGAAVNFTFKEWGVSKEKSLIWSSVIAIGGGLAARKTTELTTPFLAGIVLAGITNEVLDKFFQKPKKNEPTQKDP